MEDENLPFIFCEKMNVGKPSSSTQIKLILFIAFLL
jgi:hypothetical protein